MQYDVMLTAAGNEMAASLLSGVVFNLLTNPHTYTEMVGK